MNLNCRKCGVLLSISNSYRTAPGICKDCWKNQVKDYQERNRTKVTKRRKNFRLNNRERLNRERRDEWKYDRARVLEVRRRRTLRIRIEVFLAYSTDGDVKCRKCGYRDTRALSIDHIQGGGRAQLRALGFAGGLEFYIWLRKKRYPPGYQVLCMNCQFIKRFEEDELAKSKRFPNQS